MFHFPDMVSLQGLFYGLLMILAILVYEMANNKRTFLEACKRWAILGIIFAVFVLQAVGVVWWLSWAIGIIVSAIADYLRNRQNKEVQPPSKDTLY